MKNKKTLFLLTFVLIVILVLLFFIIRNFDNGSEVKSAEENTDLLEYTPEEEISTSQLRETSVTLYFLDNASSSLKSEGRKVDSLNLLSNPYQTLVEMLIAGPENPDLEKVFPENTRLISANLVDSSVVISFSNELLNYTDDNQKFYIINSLLNTLTQLNEVNSIKILVDDSLPQNFEEIYAVN